MDDKTVAELRPDALSPAQIEAKAEALGAGKATMGFRQSFLLAIMAGIFIGFGGMFMLLIKSDPSLSPAVSGLLSGLVFCTGLFLVITAGAELFTGNCLMIAGKLSDRYSWGKMLKSWVVVYLGNLVGALVLITLLFFAHYYAFNADGVGNAMITVAAGKVAQPWNVLFFKGILCNFLVCLAVWIGYGARTIADKFFLPMGLLMKVTGFAYSGPADISVLDIGGVLYNISAATVGNIVGGAVFVGLIYWLIYAKKPTK